MIVDLFWERSEAAIAETEKKYGKYCHTIAHRILHSEEDAAECVNDTYLAAWNAMPPHKPEKLSTFLGKLTRNLALNRYFHNHAEKRFAPTELILHEVEEILPDPSSDETADEIALKDAINGFLASLPQQTRIIFVRRYWYMSEVKEIAGDLGLTVGNVKVILHRTRKQFKEYLEKEGINV
jgi:RNA polymerase sigma-70 factor (ECF subfamily)